MAEVISLINEKGGVGKSTSAITIAQILAISEYNVLLIDLDPQMNTTKMFGQAEANPDINYEHLFCWRATFSLVVYITLSAVFKKRMRWITSSVER